MMDALSWKHHTLIQALISRGPLKEKDFHSIFAAVTGKNAVTSKKMFDEYILKINKEISFVHFELRACRDQYDGQIVYGVVNNVSDEQSKFGTKYSVPQIAFYKGIIEAIVQDDTARGSISTFDALNIRLESQIPPDLSSEPQGGQRQVPAAFRNFTMSQKEKTIDMLVQDKWLCYTPDGGVGVGTRSLLDLRSWFRSNNFPSCCVCNESGVKVELCPNEGCAVRIHKYCLREMVAQRSDNKCPGCGSQWQFSASNAEKTVLEDSEDSEPTDSQVASGPRRENLRSNRTTDESSSAMCSSQASLPSDTRRVTRSSSHLVRECEGSEVTHSPSSSGPHRKKLRSSGPTDEGCAARGLSQASLPSERRMTRSTYNLR